MQQSFLPKNIYWSLFFFLGIVYVIGLFVPLLDNDSAHHANIAMHMYLTGDYVNLVDEGKDYLDKPHLLFWLSAFSYEIFGVSGFAYKLPSFLFTIFGVYATYRLGRSLYNNEVGRLAALIIASAFAFILANNDVRMEAILTASIAFASWQLVDWVNRKSFVNVLGAAFGLALAFSTKGLIGVLIPAIGVFFYILYKKDWRLFYHPQLLLLIVSFFVFISPVLYCYYQQYDLHPEKVIRGKSNWSGVKFILWQQVFERYEGSSFGKAAHKDYLFFVHSFLWAFAPWSVLAYVAFFNRLKSFVTRKTEWFTIGTFPTVALIVTFSGFKLPHYINIIFPISAVMTSAFLIERLQERKNIRPFFITQIVISILCLVVAGMVNLWAFPIKNILVIVLSILLIIVIFLLLRSLKTIFYKTVTLSVCTSVFIFFLLNTNFYPQLLKYQAGNELALATKDKIDPKTVYLYPGLYTPSFVFYSKELTKKFDDSLLQKQGPLWILADRILLNEIKKHNYPIQELIPHYDYNIGTMKMRFINPKTRTQTLDSLFLVRVK